jgi:hypothetical protein
MALYRPKAEKKGYHCIWEAQFATFGANVPTFINILTSIVLAFISNLGAKQQAKKCSKFISTCSGPFS